jgi:hypothetical protein
LTGIAGLTGVGRAAGLGLDGLTGLAGVGRAAGLGLDGLTGLAELTAVGRAAGGRLR